MQKDGFLIKRLNYTMQNKFNNCFVWVSLSTSDLAFYFFLHEDKNADPKVPSRFKGYIIFKSSGCANVTLDFETILKSGHF